MLTEALVFPNVRESSAEALAALSLQERVRMRACPFYLTADDLLTIRKDGERPRDDIDKTQLQLQTGG